MLCTIRVEERPDDEAMLSHVMPADHPPPAEASAFGRLRVAVATALVYGAAALLWAVAGDRLPGDRWLAVHLFTLGVLTNLVLALSDHFSRALTRVPGDTPAWRPLVLNAGVLLVLVGVSSGSKAAVAVGATLVAGVVTAADFRLRRLRKRALGARFPWIVRAYERAHGAFLHGALLGGLMGTAVLTGGWYASARLSHMHLNVLGWGGLTLLGTIVFFGPSMVGGRIAEGALGPAREGLRWGATGLTVGAVGLLLTGGEGALEAVGRVMGALGLGVLALSVTAICAPVVAVSLRADPSARRPLVIGACAWFVAAAWGDVAAIATWRLGLLDAIGAALLLGVLVQAIVAALSFLGPLLRAPDPAGRQGVRARLELLGRTRALALNAGALLVVASAWPGSTPAWLSPLGWALILASAAATLVLGLLAPSRKPAPA